MSKRIGIDMKFYCGEYKYLTMFLNVLNWAYFFYPEWFKARNLIHKTTFSSIASP